MKQGYYNEKTLAKFGAAFMESVAAVKAGALKRVTISNSNSKMGAVASVSLLPFLSCPARCATTCGAACYAAKIANLRANVLKSYANNQALAMYAPALFWAQVEAAVMSVRYFRFHVSGDILNADYFAHMVEIAARNPKTEILAFTKRFEIVNGFVNGGGVIPENLHVLFSGWNNLKPENPHGFPETTVYETESEFSENWKTCGGNCFECACRGLGCWQAKTGDIIAFKKH